MQNGVNLDNANLADIADQIEQPKSSRYSEGMAVYLARECPMCGNYFGVTIARRNGSGYRPIHGRCTTCGYEIAWALLTS